MWWKLGIVFISGVVVGGVYIGIVDYFAEKEAQERIVKQMVDISWENASLKAKLKALE